MTVSIAIAARVSSSFEQSLLVWFVLGTIGTLVLRPFRRQIGGNRAKGGGPGGSEKEIVGAIWVIAAIFTALLMAKSGGSFMATG